MFACKMGWEDVGAAGEKSEVGGDHSAREIGNSVSYVGVGIFGDVLFLKHVIPTTSPCMAREIDVPVVTANQWLIRDGFDSRIYSKCGNEHRYTPCTETQPKCEQQHTSFAVVVFLRIVTEAGLMCLSTIHHWVGCG